MNHLHFLYSSLKHLRHRQKQAIGRYRSWVWFIPAVVGIFVCFCPLSYFLFVCFYPLTTAYESVFCFRVVLLQMWMKYCSVILFFMQLRAVQNWFCCIFLGSLNEWENTEVGKLNVCGCMHPWNIRGPWDLYCLLSEIVRPGFLMSATRNAVINRLYLLHLPLSYFLVTDENSESDSDTEEKLKGKANVWREQIAPDKLFFEFLGQVLSSVFCLWSKSLFPLKTQWEDKDLETAEENPGAEDFRNPKQTSAPIPIKALCTTFHRSFPRLVWCGNKTRFFWVHSHKCVNRLTEAVLQWDRVFTNPTTHLLREKTHQPYWLAREMELHCMIYC